MNIEFLKLFMDRTDYPEEAKQALTESAQTVKAAGQEEALDGAVEFFRENEFSVGQTQPLVEELGVSAGISPYTVWMLLLIEASIPIHETMKLEGKEKLFFDTFADLRYKALECKEIYNVWGTFVAFWYPIFYTGDIVKLGRLEYETITYPWDTPYEGHGVTIKKGDKVRNIHIPSSGEPFDEAARLASYKLAYEYFKEELNGGPLICLCHSWLLYPPYGELLSPTSNILSFQHDFDIIGGDEDEEFGDAWRLFGPDYQKPVKDWPERTSMQRAYKKYFLNGGKAGEGRGVLIFDGEKLLTAKGN